MSPAFGLVNSLLDGLCNNDKSLTSTIIIMIIFIIIVITILLLLLIIIIISFTLTGCMVGTK